MLAFHDRFAELIDGGTVLELLGGPCDGLLACAVLVSVGCSLGCTSSPAPMSHDT